MLQITLLADEWKSSKGGLSTMNRELAIELAKRPNVAVTFLVPKCSEADRNAACSHKIHVVEAEERPGFPPVDWLCFPPEDLVIDVIVGHGVPLGRQAQIIKKSHRCTWMQVVHTTPEELAMHKTYPDAISKGDEKQWTELKLCKMADFVVTVGPKLFEFYSVHLHQFGKTIFNLTPGIFTELSDLAPFTQGAKKFRVLLFGRSDSEDFELKGFDIAAKAVAELNDRSYQLIFVGASRGKEPKVREELLEQGLRRSRSQLTVKGFIENREDLATLLSTANLVVIPSRTEGFGLTALEALSAGLPFLVSQNSGFGEALEEIPPGLSWIIDSDDPKKWAKAIKGVREKGRETALKECQELRTLYAEKYSWEKQCKDLVETMLPLVNDKLQTSNSDQGARPREAPPVPPSSIDRTKLKEKLQTSNSEGPWSRQGARPKESRPSSIDRTKLKAEDKMPLLDSVSEPEKNRMEDKSVQPPRRRHSLQEDQPIKEQRTEGIFFTATQSRNLHLFNCDRNYNLDVVEELLAAMKGRLCFGSVKKHYFSIAQMSELTTNTIPKLHMDMAFFVVHAHESRLSINEDIAGIGYAKIYRVLLERTGGKVIIIIGGDDNYRSEDEEERVVISRWARRKMSSQFSDEYLDGSKSFIFSWNKKHRAIHEEALLHHFNPSKKGEKFEYQPKSAQTTSEKTLLRKYQSMVEQSRRKGIGSSNSSSAEQRRQDFASSRLYSADQTSEHSFSNRSTDAKPREDDNKFSHPSSSDHRRDDNLFCHLSSTEQRREGSISSDFRNAEQRKDGPSLSNLGNDTYRVNKVLVHPVQRALRSKTEDLAIFCCNVSEDSLRAVMQVLQDIDPRLNLSANPPVHNNSPDNIKQYLKEAHLKFCVLVVDGKTVTDAYENLPQPKKEYRELLETAADRVVEKVIILVCDNYSLPPKDEEIVSRAIEDTIIRRGKGHYAWSKNGQVSVDPDVLVQWLMSTSLTPQPNPQTNPSRASQEKNSDARGSAAESFSTSSGQSHSPQKNPPDREQGLLTRVRTFLNKPGF